MAKTFKNMVIDQENKRTQENNRHKNAFIKRWGTNNPLEILKSLHPGNGIIFSEEKIISIPKINLHSLTEEDKEKFKNEKKNFSKEQIYEILNKKSLDEEKVVFGTITTKIPLKIESVLERKSGEISLILIYPKHLMSQFGFFSNESFRQNEKYSIFLKNENKEYATVVTITGVTDNEIRLTI